MKSILKVSVVTVLAAVALGTALWGLGFTVSLRPTVKAQSLSPNYLPLVMKNYEEGATRTIIVPAAAFIPARVDADIDWYNMGVLLEGEGNFNAPVWFPSNGTLQSMTLWYYDDDPSADICVYLQRTTKPPGAVESPGALCTTGASPYYPLAITTTDFYDNQVDPERGNFLQIHLGGSYLRAYQVEITLSE